VVAAANLTAPHSSDALAAAISRGRDVALGSLHFVQNSAVPFGYVSKTTSSEPSPYPACKPL
jgi:hypothetical protein